MGFGLNERWNLRSIIRLVHYPSLRRPTDSADEADFYSIGFDESGDTLHENYQSKVLGRNRSLVYASLDWLKDQNAIEQSDLEAFERIKACRNALAHQLFSLLRSEGLPSDFDPCFVDMVALLRKIEVWWITNLEIATDPDYHGSEIIEDAIVPGPIIGIQLLLDIALADEGRSRFYYDGFRKGVGRQGGGSFGEGT